MSQEKYGGSNAPALFAYLRSSSHSALDSLLKTMLDFSWCVFGIRYDTTPTALKQVNNM